MKIKVKHVLSLIVILNISSFAMSQAQNVYPINGFENIVSFIERSGGNIDSSDQIEFNFSFVYLLPDSQIVMMSSDGHKALVFESKDTYAEMLEKEWFSIEDEPGPFPAERFSIKTIENNIHHYIKRLNVFGVSSLPSPDKVDVQLSLLSKEVNSYGKQNLEDSIIIAIGIYLGEIIRQDINGAWNLYKTYSINPYWIPYLNNSKQIEMIFWTPFFDHFQDEDLISLDSLRKKILAQIRKDKY